MSASYDAIIIGSGIGGLTCGAFLSRGGMKVLILEKHNRIGGYAHSFRRGKYVFDSGIHSVPMGDGGVVRELLTELEVNDRIATVEHESMFRLVSPDCTMALPSRTDDILAMLLERFPAQRTHIEKLVESTHYFRNTVREAGFDFERGFVEQNRDFVDRYHNRPFRDYIDSIVTDPQLRYLFGSMWPYIGMSAERAATVFYFMMFTAHFLEGSHYCVGGFGSLADALAGVIREGGGDVRTRQEVVSLDMDGRRIRAAVTADGARYEARVVVSNVSPYLLHGTILPEESRSKRWLRRLENLEPSVSTVGVYLGVTKEAVEHLPDCLTFTYATDDHDAIYRGIMDGRLYDDSHLILLRGAEQTDYPTILLMQFARADASANWKEEKMRVAERMLDRAEQFVPGLRRHTNIMEVGSPLTYERYTGNTAGALYGFENTASLYGEARMPTRTHLHNLYQVGHWQRPGGGIWNVMVNGRVAARRIAEGIVDW